MKKPVTSRRKTGEPQTLPKPKRGFKQRWLHFYAVNETLHMLWLLYLFTDAIDVGKQYSCGAVLLPYIPTVLSHELPRFIKAVICYYVGAGVVFAVMVFSLWVRRSMRETRTRLKWDPSYPDPITFHTHHVTTADGIRLTCRVSEHGANNASCPVSPKKKVMLLCAPLGQCGPSCYTPIMMRYGKEFVYISWDYRGLFGSQHSNVKRLAVPEHARDAMTVLDACGYTYADVVVGHSMGAAVTLELAITYPHAIGSIVCINGFHGHVFQTAFQPLVRIPFAGDVTALFIETLLAYPRLLPLTMAALLPIMKVTMPLNARFFGSPLMKKALGETYYFDILKNYFGNLVASKESLRTYLRLFQELNAHSVYHLLPTITQPVLIISGFLDCLAPAMQSAEMARRIPHAVHFCDPFSSHFSILESPEWCVAEIDAFLEDHMKIR